MKPLDITVIMPTHNRAKLLQKNIRNILKSENMFELLIINDCSRDGTEEVIRSFKDRRITYLEHSSKCGQARSINEGIEVARNSLVMLCEDDAFILDPDRFFKTLISEFNKGCTPMIVGTHLLTNGKEIKPKLVERIKGFFARPLSKEVYIYNGHKRKVVEFCNACLAFNRDGLRTRFEECDYNHVNNAFRIESDFQLRVRMEGAQIIYNPELVIDHKRYLTGGHRVHNKDSFRFQCMVNHMIFLRKHYSIWNVCIHVILELLAHPTKHSTVRKALKVYTELAKAIDTSRSLGKNRGVPGFP
jgi:glycosyltransferase involved in cell wall biosynthesis